MGYRAPDRIDIQNLPSWATTEYGCTHRRASDRVNEVVPRHRRHGGMHSVDPRDCTEKRKARREFPDALSPTHTEAPQPIEGAQSGYLLPTVFRPRAHFDRDVSLYRPWRQATRFEAEDT